MTASSLRTRPRRGRKPSRALADFAAELRRHPGKWMRWPNPITKNTAGRLGYQIALGTYAAFPPAEFQARMRLGVAYVRYIGTGVV